MLPWQKPNTPKSTPPNDARGICFTIGVEITDMSSKANAARSRIVKGVAGLNIVLCGKPPSHTSAVASVFKTRPWNRETRDMRIVATIDGNVTTS